MAFIVFFTKLYNSMPVRGLYFRRADGAKRFAREKYFVFDSRKWMW